MAVKKDGHVELLRFSARPLESVALRGVTATVILAVLAFPGA